MIKPRSFTANPWAYHTRQNGIQAGRMTYRDLHAPKRGNALTAAITWALPALALWALMVWIVWRVVELLVA
jgi:hypothetical protein